MRQMSYSALNAYLQTVARNGRAYRIEQKHSTARVYVGTKLILRGDNKPNITKSKITGAQLNLFGQVVKNVEKYILKHNNDIEKVKLNYARATLCNKDLWKSLPIGQEFYYVDGNHCFWRIGFLKGYISQALYNRANTDKELKETRNKALSCITSCKKVSYFNNEGVHINTIIENRNLFQQVFDNIRYTSYNLVAGIYHQLPGIAIGYRTDAIMVLKEGLEQAKAYFEANNMPYDVDRCVKKDDKTYINTVKLEEKAI